MVRREKVLGDDYYTHLFTLECMDTGYTIAKYINKYKYEDKYEMINNVVLGLWVYGESGTGSGVRKTHFLLRIHLITSASSG